MCCWSTRGKVNRRPRTWRSVPHDHAEAYAWKGAKWIPKIEFLAEDNKGFWEVRGYSNSAEPWFDDRFST